MLLIFRNQNQTLLERRKDMTEIFLVSFHVNQLFAMDRNILQIFWSSQKLKYFRKIN